MNGKSYFLAALALCGLGTMTGCDPGLMYPTTNYVTAMGRNMGKAIDAHDENMTEQHKIQTPELAAELDAQRALFTEQIAKLDEELAAARKKQDEAWQKISDNLLAVGTIAAELVGVPSTVTNMVREGLQPSIDAARGEADDAMNETQACRRKDRRRR